MWAQEPACLGQILASPHAPGGMLGESALGLLSLTCKWDENTYAQVVGRIELKHIKQIQARSKCCLLPISSRVSASHVTESPLLLVPWLGMLPKAATEQGRTTAVPGRTVRGAGHAGYQSHLCLATARRPLHHTVSQC